MSSAGMRATLLVAFAAASAGALPNYAATGAAFAEPDQIHDLDIEITLGKVIVQTAQATLTTREVSMPKTRTMIS